MASLYILENSIDLFYVVTEQSGKILTSNDLFREYSSHIKPINIADISATEPDRDDMVAAIHKAQGKAPEPIRVYAKTKQKNGSLRYNLWNIYSIFEYLHFVGIQLVDVTSISSHEHEKQKILLEEFRFMLSHELRQPLTSIAGLIRMMLEHRNASDQEREDLTKMIEESVSRLDDVIKLLIKKAARQI